MTEKALAANRRNAQKAGRPKGCQNAITIKLKDHILMREPELVDNLIRLALHGETEQTQVAATRELLDRAHGRAPQPLTAAGGGGDGEKQIIWVSWQSREDEVPVVPREHLEAYNRMHPDRPALAKPAIEGTFTRNGSDSSAPGYDLRGVPFKR